tara:strand:- start:138 stop:563 length:426 start_codon:yes stop_codon:yes gene_type:complete
MKILGILLSMFILIGCKTTDPVVVKPTVEKIQEKKDKIVIGVMTVSCIELSAIQDLSNGDRNSMIDVQRRLQQHMAAGKCGIHKPRIRVPLETLVDEYVDFMGIETQIWKVRNLNLWTLIAKGTVEYKKSPKQDETLNIAI